MFYALAHMYEFVKFDVDEWMSGKEFKILSVSDWKTQDGVIHGKRVSVVCVKDSCDFYKLYKNETEKFSFEFSKFSLNCANYDCNVGDIVFPSNPKASLYTLQDSPNTLRVSFSCDSLKKVPVKK